VREADEAGGGMRALPAAVPSLALCQKMVTVAQRRPCTRQKTSDWICWAVMKRGASPRASRASRRNGGTSTAIEARVEETTLYLQSGHGAALTGAGVHVNRTFRLLPRDVQGLWSVTGGRVNLAVTLFLFFSSRKIAAVCWLELRPLGLGWDGEGVVRR
jgi:hypothetical protein